MSRISSRMTFYYKRILPAFFFGFFPLIFVLANVAGWVSGKIDMLPFLIMPLIMLVFFYFIMKMFVFDLLDEVFDGGDELILRNGRQESRVKLTDIKNVSYSTLVNPPRVTLSLRQPCLFGAKVAFCPPLRLIPFATSPIIDELIDRIDAAREASRG